MPERIGKYEILSVLAEGGMGTVYVARDPVLDRRVAIKVLAPDLCSDPLLVRRFEEEAKALAKLQHPNVMSIYAVGREGARRYYAMEYVKGRTLSDLIEEGGPLPVSEAGRVFERLATALRRIHQAGIVHRDVKPGNIMIAEGGRVVLMDFGLAKSADRGQLTAAGAILGTPEYMAPEQALGEEVDARADLYALGCVLFEMLCGHPPFDAPDAFSIIRQHIEEPPPSVRAERPRLPQEADRFLSKALAKQPSERFQTAEEMAREAAPLWRSERATAAQPSRRPSHDAQTRTAAAPPGKAPRVPAHPAQGDKATAAQRKSKPSPAKRTKGRLGRGRSSATGARGLDPVAAALLAFGLVSGLVGVVLILLWWGAPPAPPRAGVAVRVTLADGSVFEGRWVSTEQREEDGESVLYGNFASEDDRMMSVRLEGPPGVRAIEVIGAASEEGAEP